MTDDAGQGTSAGSHRRYFIALWPPKAVAEEIQEAAVPFIARYGGRAIAAADLHLTLAFLGDLSPAQISAATDALQQTTSRPFELCLSRLACFRRARVLWIGPERPPDELTGLHRVLWRHLEAAGFVPEPRVFRAHVTLARKVGSMHAQLLESSITWDATTLALAASRSVEVNGGASKAPRYERLVVRSLRQ